MPKDLARLESLLVMIDRWSIGYSCAVLLVGILQVHDDDNQITITITNITMHDHDEIEISGFLLAATFQAASKYCKHESHHLIIVVANMKLSHLANKQLWFFKMERGKC